MISCPICKSKKNKIISKIYLKYFRCKSCDTIYQYPLKINKSIYETDNYFNEKKSLKTQYMLDKKNKSKFYKRFIKIKKLLDKDDKILEIGCGQGFLVKYLVDNGYNAQGSEISTYWINKIKKELNLDILTQNQIKKNRMKFNFVILYDVIEHTDNPVKLINEIKKLLLPNGKIFISTPNAGDLFSKLYSGSYEYLSFFEHPILYSKKSIKILFSKTGLNIKFYGNTNIITLILYNIIKFISKISPFKIKIFGISTERIKKLPYNSLYFSKDIWVIAKK